MKKKIIIFILLSLFLIPSIVLAQIAPTSGPGSIPNPIPGANIQTIITNVANVVYAVAAIVAVAYLIVGGYQYIMSQGNPDAAQMAKGTIINAVIGLIIIVVSYLIIRLVLGALGAPQLLG